MSYDPTGIYASANTRSKERTRRRRRRRRVCLFSLLERVCFAARCTPGTETGATRTEKWWSRKERERERERRGNTSKRSVDRIFSRDPLSTRSSRERVDRFRRPIPAEPQTLVELSCFERISRCREPPPVASSCIEQNARSPSAVSTPPV